MCVYGFYIKPKAGINLIVIGNRDEELSRKFKPLQIQKSKGILRGIDLKERGSWIGVDVDGKIAFLTNYRDPSKVNDKALSRGLIIKKFFESKNVKLYIRWLFNNAHRFNGFNLIFGKNDTLFYFSNITYQLTQLSKGLYSLSNAFLNSNWPKCIKIKQIVKDIVQAKVSKKEVFLKLKDTTRTTHNLPNTGIGFEKEVLLSPLFIQLPFYGTTTSYYITIKNNGFIEVAEMVHRENRYRIFKLKKNKIFYRRSTITSGS